MARKRKPHTQTKSEPKPMQWRENLFSKKPMQFTAILPVCNPSADLRARYRWSFHIALPFGMPSKTCVRDQFTLSSGEVVLTIGNHYNRLHLRSATEPPVMQVVLHDRRDKATLQIPPGWTCNEEQLKGVAHFQEVQEFRSAAQALENTEHKINSCLEYLADYLGEWQRSAPYSCAWLVYPLSAFDIGDVVVTVTEQTADSDVWHTYTTVFAFNYVSALGGPLFRMDEPAAGSGSQPIDVANELLAESLLSNYRGVSRLGLLNAYASVEQLANVVFLQMRTRQLIALGKAAADAGAEAEVERSNSKTDVKFLMHTGMNAACGRSLYVENERLYGSILSVKEQRNKVAHTGHKPSSDEALEAHKTCAECVRWLAGVAGMPVKPFYPDPSNVHLEGLSFSMGKFGPRLSLQKVRHEVAGGRSAGGK